MTSRRDFLILTFAASAAPLFSALAEESSPPDDQPLRFLMEDVNGVIVTDENLLGKFALIYFGYTGCPDICPTSMLTMADALAALGADAERVLPLFVTVDPDRDTAKLLSQYVSAFDTRIVALRGPKAYVDAMVKAYGAKYEFHFPDPADKTNYSVDHSASMIFQGPDGRIVKRFPHGMAAAAIASEMQAAITAAPVN
ncbi:MAG: SCO family protein [Phyllobacteriaceae bacterium]|nr:SCO family protein [Phyllobacteriaceae bacterium]